MAGELLIQTFNQARWPDIEAVIAELRTTRAVSPEALSLIRDTVAAPPDEDDRDYLLGGWDVLERIAQTPALDLRHYLSPRDINEAGWALCQVHCVPDFARWSMSEAAGAHWVFIDNFGDLMGEAWFEAAFLDPPEPQRDIDFSHDPEVGFQALTDAQLEALRTALEAGALDTSRFPNLSAELDGLTRLVQKVAADPDLALVHHSLL